MDRSSMRKKGPVDIHVIEFLDIPNEKHSVRIKSDYSVVYLVNDAANHIRKLRFVRRWNLDFAHANKDVCIA